MQVLSRLECMVTFSFSVSFCSASVPTSIHTGIYYFYRFIIVCLSNQDYREFFILYCFSDGTRSTITSASVLYMRFPVFQFVSVFLFVLLLSCIFFSVGSSVFSVYSLLFPPPFSLCVLFSACVCVCGCVFCCVVFLWPYIYLFYSLSFCLWLR